MRRPILVVLAAFAGLVALVATGPANAAVPSGAGHTQVGPACVTPAEGQLACTATVLEGAPMAAPAGYGPADLLAAYNLTSSAGRGAGQTIAVVDAYDDPAALADVNTYRKQFGIAALKSCAPAAVGASTTACFAKSDQNGGTSYPVADQGWAEEISLDVDMVSATCPKCNVLLVEANDAATGDLGASVNTAVRLGADAVSNSYGGSESAQDPALDSEYYQHPGVAVTASAGDSGFGAQYPGSSQYVTSVGASTLVKDASTKRGWRETAWSAPQCSAYEAKPSWQHDTFCTRRTTPDVLIVGDPSTGVAAYDAAAGGWLVFGGSSAGSPLIAGIYGLAQNASTLTYAKSIYTHPGALNPIPCSYAWCPGSPNGIGAF